MYLYTLLRRNNWRFYSETLGHAEIEMAVFIFFEGRGRAEGGT
jgi:hypothetical protein